MNRVLKLIFDVLEVYLGVVIFSVLLLSTFIQVFMRFVLNMPSPELFEVSIYTFVWVIYLGGALATRYDQHMRFDLILKKFPKRVQLVLNTVFDFLTNVILLFLLVPSIRYTFQVYSIKASALRIPWTYLLIVYPVFVILVLLHNFISMYYQIRELLGKGSRPEEVFPWQ
ncbi:MAG: TRAP transporter small permease [Spirochaetes bacterium]|nr:TRAP transporter small permease [Spirochaetota bacterium]